MSLLTTKRLIINILCSRLQR